MCYISFLELGKDVVPGSYFYFEHVFTSLLETISFYVTEVVEHACSITSLQQGETLPGISKDMDTYSYRIPLGVCAGISP